MFLSPSHISENSEIEDDEDFYSSSKKIESKRKAQSINQMIRKVEHVIKHSEQKANQICSEHKTKQYQDMQLGAYQPQQFSQNIQPPPFTVSNLPLPNPHYSQTLQQKIFLPSPSPRRITCPVGSYGSSIKPTQTRMSDYTSIISGEDNQTRVSGFSSALISEAARQPFTPLSTANNQLSKDSQYITAQQLKVLLEEQLSLREKSIVSQLSSCLKNLIIPEIKRQVIQDMDLKKSEMEALLKKFQGTLQEEMKSQVLDEKIASMKQSLDKQKLGRNQVEIKTQSLDQKICALENRMERLEEHSCGQIEMVENIKAESRLAIMDLKHSRKQLQRIEETVQSLSQSFFNLQNSMNKNLKEFSMKLSSLSITDEIPFHKKKDIYQTNLMDNFKQNLLDGDIVLTRDANETQKSFTSGLEQLVNPQNVESQSKQRNYEPKNLIQSFSNFDIQPTLSNEETSSFKVPKEIPSYYNLGGNISDLAQISFRNDCDCYEKTKEELLDLIGNSSKLLPAKSDTCSAAFQTQQQDSQNIIDSNRMEGGDFEQSTDINYVRKGLPQLFDYVESTYAEEDANDRNGQSEDKGQTDSFRHSSILLGEEGDVANNLDMRIQESFIVNSGKIGNSQVNNHGKESNKHSNSTENIDLEEFILHKINSSKKNSCQMSQS